MSIWSSFRGHDDQRQMFRRAIERGRLAQSFLFVGPEGIGKQRFARLLAQCLLCRASGPDPLEACGECTGCRPFLAGNHPDFLFVDRTDGKREIRIDQIAGPPERRGQEGLCHDLSLRPLEGSRKVALINDADTMNDESANSFLKMLEEPPERAVLILIASNLDAVMPTIRSRCQLIRFGPLPRADIEALLIENEFVTSPEEGRFAASLCDGSLTVARQVLRPELRDVRASLYSALSRPGFSGLSLAKSLQEAIDGFSADTAELRIHANWLIRFAVEFYRSALRCQSGIDSGAGANDSQSESMIIPEARTWASAMAARGDSLETIANLIDRSIDAAGHIEGNVPVALSLEALLNDLARMSRPAMA